MSAVPQRRPLPAVAVTVADGSGRRLAAAVAAVPTQTRTINRRSDLISRYGTAAVIGISSAVAAMSALDGEIKAVPKIRTLVASATTVTAVSMRP